MRRRYQQGSIRLENKHNPVYVGRFLEDVIQADGTIKRVQRSVRIGTKVEFPTERLARRELQRILEPINSVSYRPTRNITFKEASEQWTRDVVRMYKPASRASIKSNLKKIIERFGSTPCSQLSTVSLQAWITFLGNSGLSPKTVSNYLTTFQMMWNSLKAWSYVSGNPFDGLVLPRAELKEQVSFTPEQIREIISRAPEPYKTIFWICAETGVRGGEVCGLFKEDINLDARMIYVKRSAFQGQLQTPKTGNSVRAFPISAALCDHIRTAMRCLQGGPTNITGPSNLLTLAGNQDDERLVGARSGNDIPANPFSVQSLCDGPNATGEAAVSGRPLGTHIVKMRRPERAAVIESASHNLLFRTPRGCPYDNGNIVKRGLKPILRAMGIDGERVGLHALRHSNASVMDSLQVPMQVRMDRLGHGSEKMTMRYTHSTSQDHRIVADALGRLFSPKKEEEIILEMTGD